jgi:hypothetical protein
MNKDDFSEFCKMIDSTYELIGSGKLLSADAKALFFKAMSNYSIEEIRIALQDHIKDPVIGQFVPKPGNLIKKIELRSTNGWLGAEEAWATYPKNEQDSAMLTQESVEAFSETLGMDMIAARMAFKEIYERLITKAKLEGRKPAYFPSMGVDIGGREKMLCRAVSMRLITTDAAIRLSPIHEYSILKATGIDVDSTKFIENNDMQKKVTLLLQSLKKVEKNT